MKASRVASLAAALWLWGAAVESTGLVPLQIGINSEEVRPKASRHKFRGGRRG